MAENMRHGGVYNLNNGVVHKSMQEYIIVNNPGYNNMNISQSYRMSSILLSGSSAGW